MFEKCLLVYLFMNLFVCFVACGPFDMDQLSFMENLYVRFSSACRAIMDLQYPANNKKHVPEIEKLKVIYIGKENDKTLPITDAFAHLINGDALYDIGKETKIIIHGYNDNPNSDIPISIADSYKEKQIFNVFLIDASELIKENYIASVHISRDIGRRLANLLANLENRGANSDDIHLVGISLGAHIAGWTGKYYYKYKGRKIGRITGLDPAGPCFTYAPVEVRLDKDDAIFVEVIHVNRMIQGVLEPIGHVDYYVNGGGPNQPGCMFPSCSHSRAAQIFEESIRLPMSFVGVKCDSWNSFTNEVCNYDDISVMGYGTNSTARGVYYLKTNNREPYGLGMNGVRPSNGFKENNMFLKTLTDAIPLMLFKRTANVTYDELLIK